MYGTLIGAGPLETLIRTREPLTIWVPGGGSWPVTVFGGLLECTEKTFAFKPAFVSVLTASASVFPRTLGTVTFGLPVETWTSTLLPFATLFPAFGFWLMTTPTAIVSLFSRRMWAVKPCSWRMLTACGSLRPTTLGTATGLLLFSCSWILVYANQAATPAAARRR